MGITRILPVVFSLSLSLFLLSAVPVAGEDKTSQEVFVDLDGDGFDDRVSDANNDGIPDPVEDEPESLSAESSMHVQTINAFADLTQAPTVAPKTSWKALFGQRRIAALGLTVSRCDFDAGSGDGESNGAGGLGGGSACAGGVCLPR